MKAFPIRTDLVGTVTYLFVDEGDVVEKAQKVIGVECMKQQWDLTAPVKGEVKFHVSLGDMVEQNQIVAVVLAEEE